MIFEKLKKAWEQKFIYDVSRKIPIDSFIMYKTPSGVTTFDFHHDSYGSMTCTDFYVEPVCKTYKLKEIINLYDRMLSPKKIAILQKAIDIKYDNKMSANHCVALAMGYKPIDDGKWVKE